VLRTTRAKCTVGGRACNSVLTIRHPACTQGGAARSLGDRLVQNVERHADGGKGASMIASISLNVSVTASTASAAR